jgi:hypothetical protein
MLTADRLLRGNDHPRRAPVMIRRRLAKSHDKAEFPPDC